MLINHYLFNVKNPLKIQTLFYIYLLSQSQEKKNYIKKSYIGTILKETTSSFFGLKKKL
jgi:hypothetical protein